MADLDKTSVFTVFFHDFGMFDYSHVSIKKSQKCIKFWLNFGAFWRVKRSQVGVKMGIERNVSENRREG